MGATYLAAVTKALELAIKGDAPAQTRGKWRDTFRSTVERTTHLLKPWVLKTGVDTAAGHVPITPTLSAQDRTIARSALQELRVLLLASDLRALEAHSGLQINKALVALDGFDALSQTIAAFDFAGAVLQCEQVLRGLGDEFERAPP